MDSGPWLDSLQGFLDFWFYYILLFNNNQIALYELPRLKLTYWREKWVSRKIDLSIKYDKYEKGQDSCRSQNLFLLWNVCVAISQLLRLIFDQFWIGQESKYMPRMGFTCTIFGPSVRTRMQSHTLCINGILQSWNLKNVLHIYFVHCTLASMCQVPF